MLHVQCQQVSVGDTLLSVDGVDVTGMDLKGISKLVPGRSASHKNIVYKQKVKEYIVNLGEKKNS